MPTQRKHLQGALRHLQSALRCLARRKVSLPGTGSWRETTLKLRGAVSAARIWAHLRATTSGRRALAAIAKRRAKVIVKTDELSRVTVGRAR